MERFGKILEDAGDDADLREVMERQKASLETKIKRSREIVRFVAAVPGPRRGNEANHGTSIVSRSRKSAPIQSRSRASA